MMTYDAEGNAVIESGAFGISVGDEQPRFCGCLQAATTEVLSERIKIKS